MQASAVLLPQPEGPSKVTNSPSAIAQVEPVDGGDSPIALGELLQGDAGQSALSS